MKTLLIILIACFSLAVYAQPDTVNIGTAANDGTGDPLRTAFGIVNTNDQAAFDSLAIHLDSIQAIRVSVNDNVDSIAVHLDSIQSLRTDVNSNVDSLGVHLDTIQALRTDVNTNTTNISVNSDSITAHRTDINNNIDSLALHLDSLQAHRVDIDIALDQLQDSLGITIVTSYGADATGVADATDEIRDAMQAWAVKGGTLLFPPGTYTTSDTISVILQDNVKYKVSGYGATIDARTVSNYSATGILGFLGRSSTNTSAMSAVATMDQGDEQIRIVETDFASSEFDILMIKSTDLYNPTRDYYLKGELVRVRSVVDDTIINIYDQLQETYTPANVTIHKMVYPSVSIEGLEVDMDMDEQYGVVIEQCKNINVVDCNFHGARYATLKIGRCWGVNVRGCYIYDSWYSGTSTSYNIVINSCQDVVIDGNMLYESRHGVAVGGSDFTNRHISILNNQTFTHPDAASVTCIDTHGNTEDAIINGNYTNGMSISSNNAIISNNIIRHSYSSGFTIVGITLGNTTHEYIKVSGNTIIATNAASIGSHAINLANNWDGVVVDNVTFEGNYLYGGQDALLFEPLADSSFTINHLEMHNNTFKSYSAEAVDMCHNGTGVMTIGEINSSNNIYESETDEAFQIRAGNSVTSMTSLNDRFLTAGSGVLPDITDVPLRFVTDSLIIRVATGSDDLELTDYGQIVHMNVAGANNLTVPPNSTHPFPIGTQITVVSIGAGQTTIVAGSGVTINSADGDLKLRVQYSSGTLIKTATNTWTLVGDIDA